MATQTLWTLETPDVARALLGQTLLIGNYEVVPLLTEGFLTNKNTGPYAPVVSMAPGEVFCPRIRNSIIILFATLDNRARGGCVLIRSAEIDGRLVEGPGRVSVECGLNQPRVTGTTEILDDSTILVRITGVVPPSRPPKKGSRVKSNNGISEKIIQNLLPDIAKKFLKTKPPISFYDYLNQLLNDCFSEQELRRKIREK